MSGPSPIEEVLRRVRARQPGPLEAPGPQELTAAAIASKEAAIQRGREIRFAASCPPRFSEARLSDLEGPRAAEIAAWCLDPQGRNLVLSGPVGCGKTHAGIAALRELLPGLRSWEIRSVALLLERLRPGGPEGEMERFVGCSILLLDDVGAERANDWTAERMSMLIDARWLEQRPIIATTNLTLGPDGELIEAIGDRQYSRLVGSGAVVLELTGSDRRRA